MLYIGLMSGTSANGIDGALVDLTDTGFRLLATRTGEYSPGVGESIEAVIRQYPDVGAADLKRLDESLGADFARVANALRREAESGAAVAAIGSHGQTVYHGPGDSPPVTVQLGSPRIIADLTGITTIGDFRRNDLLAGGQGAPLAPGFHNAMFRDARVNRLVVNIGGIANITVLPADRQRPVIGFDTGPGNTLMDQWCRIHNGTAFDHNGEWASGGLADEAFIEALLSDPYFAAPAPKSTGREYFHLDWMKSRCPSWQERDPRDVQTALLELTCRSIVRAAAGACGDEPFEMYVCGGGARNERLMDRLAALTGEPVATTEALGLLPEWVEACAFAWLAHRRLHERPGNLPSVTGATREVLLGEIHAAAASPAEDAD